MAEEKTDQAEAQSAPRTLSDYFDLGFKDVDETAKKETKPTESKQEAKTGDATADDECVGCTEEEKRKKAEAKPPYKVIKVDGKDVPVATEEEAIALMQKGFDYTKKTQEVAEARKEVDSKATSIEALSKKFNDQWELSQSEDGIEKLTKTPEGETKSPTEIKKDIFDKLGIDPELADDDMKKVVGHLQKIEESNESLSKRAEQSESIVRAFVMDRSQKNLEKIIFKAEEQYPLTRILDEDGNNVTGNEILSRMFAKSVRPETVKAMKEGKTSLPALAIEAVKELHSIQQSGNKGPQMPKAMSEEDLKKNYPDLYAKVQEVAKKKGITEYLKDLDETAPSSETARIAVDRKASDKGKIDHDDPIGSAMRQYEKDERANA